MNGIWEKTLKRLVLDFKGFARVEGVAKINKTVAAMVNNLNLGEEDAMEELLELVPEELTNELLELEQEHRAEEAREKEPVGEEKEQEHPQENSQ